MRLVGLLPAPGSGQSDPPWARPAKLSVSLRGDARERDGVTTGGIKLEAAYGAANGGLSLKYSGGLEGWRAGSFDVELNGQSPNSRELAAFIGFTPVAGGDEPARFKLTGTGAVESGVVTSAELAIFGSELRFSGSIGDRQGGLVATGRAAILAERVDGLYHALGLPLLDHGPAGRVLSAEGEVDLSRERLEVKSVAGAAAGASFTGSGSLGFLGERLALQASAETGRLDFANTLGLLILPRDGKPVGATQPFASALVDAASLDIDLKSNSLLLVPGLAFKPARFKAKGGAEALTITAEGESLPGRRSVVEATIARDGKGYRLSGSVDIAGDLGNLLLAEDRRGVLIGQAHVTGQFTSSGLSVGGLFAAMGGSGTIALDNGVLRGVDPLAFAGGLESARTPVEIDHLVDSVLRAGELRFKGANAAITMQGGVVSTAPLQIAAEAVDGRLKLMLDTAAAEADVSAMLTLKGIPGEPTFEVAWGGPADALEASYDVSGLKSNISVGVLSKGIDKLEELQREQARLVAEEQAFAREQAVKFTERSLRRQARDFVALEARRKAEEEARREKERQARLLSEATARLKVEELRRLIDEEARRRAALQPSVPPSSPPVGKSELPPLAPVFGSQSSIPAPPDEADPQKARDRAAAKAQDTITEVPPAWPAERKNRDIR